MRNTLLFGLVVLATMGSLSGCGSSSKGTIGESTSPTVVTRATEGNFSLDAKVLAARESTDGWISASIAKQVDGDLTQIRAKTPAVASLHALSASDLKSVLVMVNNTASWKAKWSAGTVDTGVSAIDTVSRTYKATSVGTVSTNATYTLYKLNFTDPLATSFVASAYRATDAGIRGASVNGVSGDGNNITRKIVGSTRVYEVSTGWGDCLAGCIHRHTWTFTIASDGNITVVESGTPLP